jgi:hypothetical protein
MQEVRALCKSDFEFERSLETTNKSPSAVAFACAAAALEAFSCDRSVSSALILSSRD